VRVLRLSSALSAALTASPGAPAITHCPSPPPSAPPFAPPSVLPSAPPPPPPSVLPRQFSHTKDSEASPQSVTSTAPKPESSWGSAGHAVGRCKPCAFLHTVGCANGTACQFCHLCEPGEKRRRRKEKIESRRTGRKLRQALGGSRAHQSKTAAQ
jgi:hypothetical protein